MRTKPLYYLAHPYSAPTPEGIEANVRSANAIAADLINNGLFIYSPISMTHGIHLEGVKLGYWKITEQEVWYKYDHWMMDECDAIIMAGNWEMSRGCVNEKKYFISQGKLVYDYKDLYFYLRLNKI